MLIQKVNIMQVAWFRLLEDFIRSANAFPFRIYVHVYYKQTLCFTYIHYLDGCFFCEIPDYKSWCKKMITVY